jgi:sugar O-acyltransferase (sialic acid O-acetyltransferase NeuD family)
MTMPYIVLIGAGGHGRAVLQAMRDAGWPDPVVLDDNPASPPLLGLPVRGPVSLAASLRAQGLGAAHVALGDNSRRAALGQALLEMGFELPVLRHPSAVVAGSATLGPGSLAMPRCVVGAAARVGRHVILNSGCILEHDGVVEDAAHLAPGCVLGGGVRVGAGALVGLGAAIRPGLRIGAGAVVGLGAAVIADVAAGRRVAGVPAVELGGG